MATVRKSPDCSTVRTYNHQEESSHSPSVSNTENEPRIEDRRGSTGHTHRVVIAKCQDDRGRINRKRNDSLGSSMVGLPIVESEEEEEGKNACDIPSSHKNEDRLSVIKSIRSSSLTFTDTFRKLKLGSKESRRRSLSPEREMAARASKSIQRRQSTIGVITESEFPVSHVSNSRPRHSSAERSSLVQGSRTLGLGGGRRGSVGESHEGTQGAGKKKGEREKVGGSRLPPARNTYWKLPGVSEDP